MSKQLKLKFKKILKKAEFVQADLSYHVELEGDAKRLFNETVRKFIRLLPENEQQKIKDLEALQQAAQNQQPNQCSPTIIESNENSLANDDEFEGGDVVVSEHVWEEDPAQKAEKNKLLELKRLFRRVAEHTHPDKVRASGFSPNEVRRLERIFKKALEAYNNNNWYLLYSIALELEISTEDVSSRHIEWLEDDIRKALELIAKISNQIAWRWYTGDASAQKMAIANYFRQAYNIDHPGL